MSRKSFGDVFGGTPAASADAPGRVNLLGEHTDYNDGFVLPTAIPQRTRVQLRPAPGERFSLYAAELDESAEFTLAAPPQDQFARYVYGCLHQLQAQGVRIPALQIHVDSDVPMGVGLSSSAALEVATLRALRTLLQLTGELDDVRIAQLAQRAEIEDAGVNCGIMDQMASSLADDTSMLFLDTRTLERRVLPLPAGSEVLVIDSGMPRTLAGSAYNERRAECEAAAAALGVKALRDVSDVTRVEGLPEPMRRRARHVVTENERVLRAITGIGPAEFGVLMNASHDSLRDDYEVSIPELDRLVGLLRAQPEVHGARLTGAGFGGACVALCRAGEAVAVSQRVLAEYGSRGRLLVPAG
ncbi:galactokinase [Ideonella sp. BN130291]|uniref:galactokinase n=1 Tax=Ideonella sp. BN130291 TaxID=3112940 RepID=UPI002E272ED3|nr:galactokinase [Ideonella sp. BN130291]